MTTTKQGRSAQRVEHNSKRWYGSRRTREVGFAFAVIKTSLLGVPDNELICGQKTLKLKLTLSAWGPPIGTDQ